MQREVNGISIAYDRVGSGPCVVFCHSLGMTREMWFQQVPVFSQRYQVLTYDARGHGQSTKAPGPYSFELLAEDLYALLQAEGIESAAVIGLSMGGNTAQALTAAHPEVVKALVLTDTTAWYGPSGPENWEKRAREVEQNGLASIIDFQLARWFSDDFRASHPELMARVTGWLTANDVGGYTATQRALGAVDLRGRVEQIRCPTLIIVGEDDPATPVAMARDLHQRIAGSRLVILPQAKHMSPVEQAERFNAEVLAFLTQVGY